MMSVTLPWPPAQLSPNFRTRRASWIGAVRKAYRAKVAEAIWARGVRPTDGVALREIIFHPPTRAKRDDDNLRAMFKAGRDAVAEVLGVDDVTFNEIPHRIGAVVKGGSVVAMIETP